MTAYIVYANGIDMGRFDEPSEARAIHAYVSMLGYASTLDAAETLGKTQDEFLAELSVEKIDD